MSLTKLNVLSFSFSMYNYTNAIWNSRVMLMVRGKDSWTLNILGDSFEHPRDQRWDSKATVVKEVLKYLQYIMSCL